MKRYISPFVFIVIVFIASFVIWYLNQKTDVKINPESLIATTESIFGNDKKMNEIRNRENVKRQQELIVQEVYLIEEKDRINKEKEEAIKTFDDQITKVETQLETVRKEKISF